LKQLAENNPERWRAHLLSGKIALNAEPPQIQHALLDLEIALALSHSVGASDRLWEIHALLAYGYHRQGRENEAGFHAGQFQRTLEELRSKIPIPYRTMFEQRPDIHDAQQKVESILSPNLDATPSLVEFKRLLEFNQDLTRFLPVEQLLHRILERALDLTGAERGFVILHQGEELKVLAECNVVPDLTKAELASFSHSIAHSVIKENRSVLAMDAMEDTRFRERLSLAHLSVRAVISVPLRMKNQIWGVLYLDHRFKAQVFQQKHIQLLELFAEQAGIALHNAQLFEEETSKNQTLTQARAQTENRNQELAEQVAQQSEVINSIHIRLRSYEEELIRQYQEAKIVGRSPPMIKLYDQINRVAESELPIFIWGESGTGKELVARAIHYTSSRKKHPFVAINCAAIPHPLLESELFGHARGAFTGAHRPRPGLFEVAGYGTLFLDEIGEMPFEMQSKLLRVLQESTFRRLGEESERQCYCRVISASNQHLDGLVTQKKFRQDLYYRLNVLQLRLPALRERSEDIPLLAEYFLAQSPKHAVLTPEAMAALLVYDWPGNIRQLENEIQRAAFLGEGVISLNVLTIPTAQQPSFQPSPAESPHINLEDAVSRFERQLINTALANAKNKVSLAAERLGMHRTALYKKMRQLGIRSSRSKPKIKR
jgi:transcriptional regulator with GAF, ATPase, and Fis domain